MIDLYGDPSLRRILLADIAPLHKPSGARVTFYVGSEMFATAPTDTPASEQYVGCVKDDVFVSRAMWAGDRFGGRSLPDSGQLSIINAREPVIGSRFDAWLDPELYSFQGAPVRLHLLAEGLPYAERVTYEYVIQDIDYDASLIRLPFKSLAYLFERPLVFNRFGGTGAGDGTADMAGRGVPICLGHCANLEPVIVDPATLLLQFGDGQGEAVEAVRDKGAAFDTPDDYTATLSASQIDVVSSPAGRITADVKGSTLGGTYSAKPADLLRYVATQLGITQFADDALAAMNAAAPFDIGYYTGTDEPQAGEFFDQATNSVGGYYGFNWRSEFDCGVFGLPTAPAELVLTEEDIERDSLTSEPLGGVVWKVVYNYRPNFARQSADELAAGVAQAERTRYGLEYQLTTYREDAAIKADYPDAIVLTVNSLVYEQADADLDAQRIFDFWSVPRRKYSGVGRNLKVLQVELNQTLRLYHPRLNLAGGKATTLIQVTPFFLKGKLNFTSVG